MDITRQGHGVTLTVEDCNEQTRQQIHTLSQNGVTETALNLDEIFEAYVVGPGSVAH